MKTSQGNYLEFLGQENVRFTIPMYQRSYAWVNYQCFELWEDILRAGRLGITHYMSMVLLLDVGEDQHGVRCYDVIDGQQRITTTVILMAALERFLKDYGPVDVDGESLDAVLVRSRYLEVLGMTKIRSSNVDQDTLEAVICGAELPARISERVVANFGFFHDLMMAEDFDAAALWRGLNQLIVIYAELDPQDKAQAIFESLNTKGIPLTAADLARNYLLVGETRSEQERLYNEYWNPIEIMYADDASSSASLKLNTGLRMWLTIQTRGMKIRDRSRTYSYFKTYMASLGDDVSNEDILDELRVFNLLWAENYELHPGRTHCSSMEWGATRRPNLKTLGK